MKIGLIIALLAIQVFTKSYGCTCIGELSLKKEFKISDIILVGKILSKDTLRISDQLLPALTVYKIKYQVLITHLIKGKLKNRVVSIISGIGKGDCGFSFEEGKEYLIYSKYENKYYAQGETVKKYLSTDICTRTKEIFDDKREIEYLIEFKKKLKWAK